MKKIIRMLTFVKFEINIQIISDQPYKIGGVYHKKTWKKLIRIYTQLKDNELDPSKVKGFDKFVPDHSSYTSNYIWLNNKSKIIVKKPFIIANETVIPHKAIPTLTFVRYNKNLKVETIVIQPFAEVAEEIGERGRELFDKDKDYKENYGCDGHEYNWGLWNKQIVKIDW